MRRLDNEDLPVSREPAARAEVALYAFLPGALAGVHLALLLFFINPGLPFGTLALLRVSVMYGLFLGALSLLAHWPLTWKRRDRARRILPWMLTAVLAAAAIMAWTHASHFAFFLPAGINSRLIKAAAGLSALTLLAFYTALLHSQSRRPYGPRSRWGFVLFCVGSIFLTIERRAAYRPEAESFRISSPPAAAPQANLIVVGLEGATMDALLPLAEQGRIPFLASMLRTGAAGRLASFGPYRRSTVWTTLATGKNPHRHEVLGPRVFPLPFLGPGRELDLLPAGIGFRHWGLLAGRPLEVNRSGQAVLSIWQILERLGSSTGIVGWPATDPVPEELEFALAGTFFRGLRSPRNARPADLAERARLFRLQVEDVDPVLLGRFGREPPAPIQQSLAADVWRQSLSLFLLEQDRQPSGFFLVLPGLAAVSESYFGGFAATQLAGEEGEAEAAAAELVAAYYGEIDAFLAQLWERARQPAFLAVVSPAGVEQVAGLRGLAHSLLGGDPQAGSFEGAPDGVFLVQGPGVLPGARLTGASILDVAPTLLYALGFPIGRDLEGKVLTSAFDPQWRLEHPLSFLPTYEALSPVRPEL